MDRKSSGEPFPSESEKSNKKKFVFRAGVSPVDSNKKLGPIRSHLYTYGYAKSEEQKGNNSTIIYRVDDTDKNKHTREKSEEIFQFFTETLGLQFDVTPDNAQERIGQSVYQSERQDIYSQYIERLFERDIAFVDKESGLALFNIQKFVDEYTNVIEIDDVLRGKIKIFLEENIDRGQRYFPLMRSDRSALYHLSSVADDAEFGVSHVVRGVDKLPIVEFQEMVRVALGLDPKVYLHTPLLLDDQGKMLGGKVKFDDFIEKGFLPHAVISYMISSGYGEPERVYPSLDEFIRMFDHRKIHKKNGKFDLKKLKDINKKLAREISHEAYGISLDIYLQRNHEEEILLYIQHDRALRDYMVELRREPADALGILQAILMPKHEKIDEEKQDVIRQIIAQLRTQQNGISILDNLGYEKRQMYDALRWILVGKEKFPEIDKVLMYLQEKGMLMERLCLAEKNLVASD